MKKIILLQFLFLFCTLSSQTNRFIYELSINKSDDNITKANMVLDINVKNNEVKFYDYDFLTIDSLRQKTNKENLKHYSNINQVIKRSINSSENKLYRTHMRDYYEIKTDDKMIWKIEPEKKTINKITVYKATTDFGGRKWIAWYYPEIPIQEGPYKFNGLPGLIFEIYDNENIYHYTMVRNYILNNNFSTHNFIETNYGNKPIPVSLEKFQEVKLNYYHNIIKILNDFSNQGGSIAYDENSMREKNLQRSIRNHYFPIERDKAIPYPNK